MKDTINIGDKLYHVRLDSFVMADNSKQLEARITWVEIAWIHNFQNESTKYIYLAWAAMLHWVKEDFYETEEIAREAAREKINWITITFMDHKSEEELRIENEEEALKLKWPTTNTLTPKK